MTFFKLMLCYVMLYMLCWWLAQTVK